MVKEYNKKIKFIQWIGNTEEELFNIYKEVCKLVENKVDIHINEKACLLRIKYPLQVNKSDVWVDLGSYVIMESNGDIHTCTEKEFIKNYNAS